MKKTRNQRGKAFILKILEMSAQLLGASLSPLSYLKNNVLKIKMCKIVCDYQSQNKCALFRLLTVLLRNIKQLLNEVEYDIENYQGNSIASSESL